VDQQWSVSSFLNQVINKKTLALIGKIENIILVLNAISIMIFLAVDLFCVRNFLFIDNNIPYLGKKKNLPGYQKQSREVTLMNGKRKIQQIASALKLKGHHVESADRFFKLAVQHNFVQVHFFEQN
jgi:hypothetical protein